MLLGGCAVGEASGNFETDSVTNATDSVQSGENTTEDLVTETTIKEYAAEEDSSLLDEIPNAELDTDGQPAYSAEKMESSEEWEVIFSQDYIYDGQEMVVELWFESAGYTGTKLSYYPSNEPDALKEVTVPLNEYRISEILYSEEFILIEGVTGAHELISPLVFSLIDGEWVETFAEKAQEYTYELTLGDDLQGKVIFEGTEIPFDASEWAQTYQDYGFYADGKKTDRAIELEKEIGARSFLPVESVTVDNNELVLSTSVDNYAAWDDLVQLTARFAYVEGEWVITKVTGTQLEYPY